MTRFTSSANQTGSEGAHVILGALVHLDLSGGDLYLWDGLGSLSWNSQTWLGTGGIGSVEPLEEAADDRPRAVRLRLSGINTALATAALSENYWGRSVNIYIGWFNENGALLADPELEFEGRIDDMKIEVAEGKSTLEVTAESRLILWDKSNGSSYTDSEQKRLFAGDKFFDQICIQADQYLLWGKLNFGGGTVSSGSNGEYTTVED